MKVLAIIVTYNAMRWIDKCLPSLTTSSMPIDCIVIDNQSKDETVTHIKANYSFCKLIESQENLGFGRANNIGLQYAIDNNYDYVYLLNQDAWIYENTIETLISISKQNPQYGILSPLQINSSLNKFDKNFLICCPKSMLSDSFCRILKPVYETDFVMAAHWFMPIATVKTVGGFSLSFPHYGEDHNYVHRVVFHGLKIGIVPSVSVVHDREFRTDAKSLKIRKLFLRSIVDISNPNKSLIKNLIIQPLVMIKHSIGMRSYECLWYAFSLVSQYKTLIANRQKSRYFSFLKK